MHPVGQVLMMPSAAVAGADARYWRVNVTALTSGDIASIVEVQFYDGTTGFGANKITGGTESSSSDFSGTFTPDNAIDGVIGAGSNVGWASTNTAPAPSHWWKYDFGSNKTITGMALVSTTNKDFTLQSSPDNSVWTTMITATGVTGWNANGFEFKRYTRSGLPSYTGSPHGTWQHWRLRLCEDHGGTISSFTEIEMRATPSGADQCTGGTAIESGHVSTFVAANAFDNVNSTFFASTVPSGSGVYVGYSFASPVAVAQLSLRIREDSSNNQAPKVTVVEYSSSSSGPWTFAWMIMDATAWSIAETRVYTDPNYV